MNRRYVRAIVAELKRDWITGTLLSCMAIVLSLLVAFK